MRKTRVPVLLTRALLYCFLGVKGNSAEAPKKEPDSDDGKLKPIGKLELYAAAIGTFLLLGIWLFFWATRSKRCNILPPQVSTTCHHLSFEDEELRLATRGYHPDNILGSTNWSSVFKGFLQDGLAVAIKRLHLHNSDESTRSFVEVSNALTDVRQRNLVRVLGYSVCPDYKVLVMEYVDCLSLDQLLHRKEGEHNLSWEIRIKIAQGTARALVYMHEECGVINNGPIVHGNLKPSNIFVDMDDKEPLLSDYGIASLIRNFSDSSTAFQGLCGYAAPECKRSDLPTPKSDVYSFGMVLLQLLTLKRPTSEVMNGDLPGWVRCNNRYGEILDPSIFKTATAAGKKRILKVLGLALLCTREDPNTRPSMKGVQETLIQLESFGMERMEVETPALEIVVV